MPTPGARGSKVSSPWDLHRAGFTALEDAPSDVYGTLLAESFEPEVAVAGLGESYRIEQNYFKFHACCRMNHRRSTPSCRSERSTGSTGDEVATVHITSIPFGLRMLETEPQSMLGAKFSIPTRWRRPSFSAARTCGLRGGRARRRAHPRHGQAHRRVADDEMALKRADYPTAHVRIGLRDGRMISRARPFAKGTPRARWEVRHTRLG